MHWEERRKTRGERTSTEPANWWRERTWQRRWKQKKKKEKCWPQINMTVYERLDWKVSGDTWEPAISRGTQGFLLLSSSYLRSLLLNCKDHVQMYKENSHDSKIETKISRVQSIELLRACIWRWQVRQVSVLSFSQQTCRGWSRRLPDTNIWKCL